MSSIQFSVFGAARIEILIAVILSALAPHPLPQPVIWSPAALLPFLFLAMPAS
jgi:hypothetical protein